MVDINELYITPDNQKMIIDVSVPDDDIHKNIGLKSITLDTQDTVTTDLGQPSTEWIIKRDINKTDEINNDGQEQENLIKHARIELCHKDIERPLSDTMFFVWVEIEGSYSPDTPCGKDTIYTLGVCVNEFTIYRTFMCLMRELLTDCEVPKHFIDLYLRWQGVKMAVATGNYQEAILLWKRFFLFKHQRPLWEHPQYVRFWKDWHKDSLLPDSNYEHPVYGWGGSFFNQRGNYCRTCRR